MEAKDVDPNFMLGIKKHVRLNEGKNSLKMDMSAYIKGMCDAFKDHILRSDVPAPFPPGKILFRSKEPDKMEVEEVLKLGYQRAVGVLLWAQRGVYPECAYGMNQLCRFMTAPSREAFKAAMYMMAWMRQNAEKGIQFTSDGNEEPIVFSDAAFNPDTADGLSAGISFLVCRQVSEMSFLQTQELHVTLCSSNNDVNSVICL